MVAGKLIRGEAAHRLSQPPDDLKSAQMEALLHFFRWPIHFFLFTLNSFINLGYLLVQTTLKLYSRILFSM